MPKRVDIETQRRSIASAAISVIHGAGLEGTRLRDVARAAHVTTGAVTHYFDGKEAVLEAALEEVVRRTLQRLGRGRQKAPKDVETFVAQACAHLPVDEASQMEWRVWLAFWGKAIADDRLRAIHRRYYEAFVEHVANVLQTLNPKASSREALLTADAVIATLDGVGVRAILEPEHWPSRRQRQTATALLVPMLREFEGAKKI
jgi:TetR/AcrR family transcriptional regulator, transcriptional repressor of bet genes